jgi:hypothetical protein
MSYSLALLRADLRTHLGMDSSDLSDADADRLLNRSYWALQSKLRFNVQEEETSFDTVASMRNYATPTGEESVQALTILDDASGLYTPLKKIDDWNMFPLRDDDTESIPTHYSRRNDEFILHPNPDDVYTIRVKYRATLADLQSSGPEIPQEWHEVILMGAVYRGFFVRGDVNRAEKYRGEWATLVNLLDTDEEKEVEDRRYSGVTVMRRRYP